MPAQKANLLKFLLPIAKSCWNKMSLSSHSQGRQQAIIVMLSDFGTTVQVIERANILVKCAGCSSSWKLKADENSLLVFKHWIRGWVWCPDFHWQYPQLPNGTEMLHLRQSNIVQIVSLPSEDKDEDNLLLSNFLNLGWHVWEILKVTI